LAEAPGAERFARCRWQRAADGDAGACCSHRDVLPMAGTTGFNPDAWCVDCGHFKARRAPRRPGTSDAYRD
jgi:hypothetical protein